MTEKLKRVAIGFKNGHTLRMKCVDITELVAKLAVSADIGTPLYVDGCIAIAPKDISYIVPDNDGEA